MLKRKASAAGKASHSRPTGGAKKTEGKSTPARRRFVISSKAKREASKPAETSSKAKPAKPAKTTAPTVAVAAQKATTNGHPNAPVSAPTGATVDLTETIKTLVHIGQEHGYVTYDDINDVL